MAAAVGSTDAPSLLSTLVVWTEPRGEESCRWPVRNTGKCKYRTLMSEHNALMLIRGLWESGLWSQVAERLRNRASNLKVASSIPECAK